MKKYAHLSTGCYLLLLAAGLGLNMIAMANDFIVPEYLDSGLSWIGAEAAYKQGYTGKGVGVAVVDLPIADHSKLKGCVQIVGKEPESKDSGKPHGTRVAGVVGARRDESEVHGVAFDSMIYGLDSADWMSVEKFSKAIESMPDVRIYNNSIGIPIDIDDKNAARDCLAKIYAGRDIVAVFAAENEGGRTDGFPFAPYYHQPTITNFINATSFNPHVITRDENNRLVLPPSAVSKFTNLAGEAALWSVMAPGSDIKVLNPQDDGYTIASGTSLAAPAVSGALALVQQKYPWMSARQLADTVLSTANNQFVAPDYIVQTRRYDHLSPKFWPRLTIYTLEGSDKVLYLDQSNQMLVSYFSSHPDQWKQLGFDGDVKDVLSKLPLVLEGVRQSTREEVAQLGLLNNDELNGSVIPGYVVQIKPSKAKTVNIVIGILNSAMELPTTTEQVKKMVDECVKSYPEAWKNEHALIDSLEEYDAWSVEYVTFEEVFGQGLLDISKAINGPARLDANRLSETDIIDLPELGEKAVLDTFNTKGYTAFFDNDITERRWMDHYVHPDLRTTGSNGDRARALNGLSVGLRKAGQGTLVLRGENSYTGLTVVDEGTLVITPREDGSGGKLLNSTAVVNKQGTLSGNGFIKNIVNHGTVKPIGILKTKNYTQGSDGILHIGFGSTGSSSIETDTAKLAGILLLEPSPIFYSSTDALELDVVTGQIVGNFENIQVTNPSPTLTFNATSYGGKVRAKTCSLHSMYFNRNSPRRLAITITRPLDAYAKFAKDANAKRVGESLVEMTSNEPSSEIKELITKLDWHTTPAEIGNMLHALSPESYDVASFIMLKQQKELTKELFSNLGHKAFVLPIVSSMHYAGKVSSYTSDNAGVLIAGGKKLGAYLGLMGSRSRLDHADFNTASVNFGSYALLFDHLKFQAGATVSSSSMKRSSYETTRSHWTESGFNLAFALDKKYQLNNRLTLTPFGETSFNLTHRPSLSEKDGSYMNLMLASSNNKSLNSTLGVKADIKLPKDFALILVTAWQHEYLDPAMRTQATALGFTPANFYSLTKLMDCDSLLIGGDIKLTRKNLQAKLSFTSERSRTGHINTLRMGLGWRF